MNVLDTRTSGQEEWLTRAWAEIRTSARTLATGPLRLQGDTHSDTCRFPRDFCSCNAAGKGGDACHARVSQ